MLLRLDFSGEVPIYQQIRNQIVLGMAEGKLEPGQRLPSTRALAEECGVNVMTISKAYQMLKSEGYLTADRRGGTVVCAAAKPGAPKPETLAQLRLCLGELRLAGLSEAQAVELCRSLYHADGPLPPAAPPNSTEA